MVCVLKRSKWLMQKVGDGGGVRCGGHIKGHLYGYAITRIGVGLSGTYKPMLDSPIDFTWGMGSEGEIVATGGVQRGIEADSSLIHYSNMHGVLSI